jgi:hypothetical protein
MWSTSQHEVNLVYQISNKKRYIDMFAHLDALRLPTREVGVLSLRGQAAGGSFLATSKYRGMACWLSVFAEVELHKKARTGEGK